MCDVWAIKAASNNFLCTLPYFAVWILLCRKLVFAQISSEQFHVTYPVATSKQVCCIDLADIDADYALVALGIYTRHIRHAFQKYYNTLHFVGVLTPTRQFIVRTLNFIAYLSNQLMLIWIESWFTRTRGYLRCTTIIVT